MLADNDAPGKSLVNLVSIVLIVAFCSPLSGMSAAQNAVAGTVPQSYILL